jgi:putative ABC transport system permease protein
MPVVAQKVDELYTNSRARTKTETEKQFQQSFVSMSSAIITSLEVVSIVIIGVTIRITVLQRARKKLRAALERRREAG